MHTDKICESHGSSIAVVILFCRIYIGSANTDDLQLFLQRHEVDWNDVYQVATVHRIRQIVYQVMTSCKAIIDQNAVQKFRTHCLAFSGFAFERKRESERIIRILQQKEIPAKMYKGLAFAEAAYGDIGMREFSDMDIIIPEGAVPEIIKVMQQEGYNMLHENYYNRFPEIYLKRTKDISFYKKAGNKLYGFEFHYRQSKYHMELQLSFADILGHDYLSMNRTLNAEDHFSLMLINNGVSDYFPNLRSVMDLTLLFRNSFNNIAPALHSDLAHFLFLWQQLAATLLEYPESSTDLHKQTAILISKILSKRSNNKGNYLKRSLFRYRMKISFKGQLSFMLKCMHLALMPCEDDISVFKLPWFFLYYFTKPYRLVSKLFLTTPDQK